MSKILKAIKALPHVMYVDDERRVGNAIIVTLEEGYCFANDPCCGVQGFDTVADARKGVSKNAVIKKAS